MTSSKAPRIACIHALEASVAPTRAAFAAEWPDADVFDLLETALSTDRARLGLEGGVTQRIAILAEYAYRHAGATGILFTCSAFGPAIRAAAAHAPVPVLTPNEAAFDAAIETATRIGLLVTFEPSLGALEQEIAEAGEASTRAVVIVPRLVTGALAALQAGDADTHDRLIAEAAAAAAPVDAFVLGQFSMARAAPAVRSRFEGPVITTPEAAVRKLRSLVS